MLNYGAVLQRGRAALDVRQLDALSAQLSCDDAINIQFSVDCKTPKHTLKRQMASFPRTKSLGFETDTDKVTHAKNQRRLPHSEEEEAAGSAGKEEEADPAEY
jgi:hypothetical protein